MAQTVGLHEVFQQLKTLVYGIWRKRWYMMATTWLICLVGWGLLSTMPYTYQSSAQVLVDDRALLPNIVGINIDIDPVKKLDEVRKTLVTRPNLEKIIRRSEYLERLARNEAELASLVSSMQGDIRVVPLDASLYRIEYQISDGRLSDRQRAEVAKNVVNNLLSFFIEAGEQSSGADTKVSRDVVDSQLAEFAERLNAAETAHAKFKQDNLEYVGGQSSFLQRRDSAQSELRKTRNEIGELRVTLQTLSENIKNVPATIRTARSQRGGGSVGDEDPTQARITELEKKLDQFRTLGYTPRHPDVRGVQAQIDGLKKEMEEKQAEIAAEINASAESGKTSNYTTETPNRLYEDLMLQIITTRTNIRRLEQRETEQQKIVSEMEEKAKRVPAIEAEEAQLQRDFNEIRRQYNRLLQQQQELGIAESVSSVDTLNLRIVEPPSTPTAPSGPPRALFLAGMLVGAIIAGVGVALILSMLRPVVLTVEQLRLNYDLTVLGNVSRSLSEEESRKRSIDLLSFAGATAGLFVIFAGFVVFDMMGGPGL